MNKKKLPLRLLLRSFLLKVRAECVRVALIEKEGMPTCEMKTKALLK